jgi:hypothetical protein
MGTPPFRLVMKVPRILGGATNLCKILGIMLFPKEDYRSRPIKGLPGHLGMKPVLLSNKRYWPEGRRSA